MANVGYQSAYAVSNFTQYCIRLIIITDLTCCTLQTDIIAVQRVYYNQIYSFGYQWMVTMSTQLVGPRLTDPHIRASDLTVPLFRHVTDWFLHWWYCSPFPRLAPVHDLAGEPGHLCAVQYPPLAAVLWCRNPRRYLP